MVSGKRDVLLERAGLTPGTSISASTGAGHKTMSLVTMPRNKSRGYIDGLAGYIDKS